MNPPSPPILRNLIAVADSVGLTHGVPLEAALFHALALGSGLAGDLVGSQTAASSRMPAKFSLVVRTYDDRLPLWIGDEWARLVRRQEESCNTRPMIGKRPHSIASLRRQRRVIQSLGAGFDDPLQLIDFAISQTKDKLRFRHFHRVGCQLPTLPKKDVRTLALAAAGAAELRRVLRSRQKPKGLWHMLQGGESPRSNLIAWMRASEAEDICRETGKEHFSMLGYRLECPASIFCPETHVPCGLMATDLLRSFELVRSGKIAFAFTPPAEPAALLVRQVGETRALLDTLPEADRGAALPDVYLAWHLSAILAALCFAEARVESPEVALSQSARIGCRLASWVTVQHLHHFRHAHPSDGKGDFTGQDLRVFRFLGPEPATPRQFQRRLRGVDKASCLRSLNRALEAGLAVEPEPGKFAAEPPPPLGSGLSDFLSEFRLRQDSPPDNARNSTESTEKSERP
jgi:hypothetical protein